MINNVLPKNKRNAKTSQIVNNYEFFNYFTAIVLIVR